MNMKIILGLAAGYLFLNRSKSTSPAAQVVLIPSQNPQQQQQPQAKGSGGGSGSGGGGSFSGPGGGGSRPGTSAAGFPLPTVAVSNYGSPGADQYGQLIQSYTDEQNADPPTAPTLQQLGLSGGPGDTSTAEAALSQDSTVQGILNAPIAVPTLAPQPDTSSSGVYDPSSDPNVVVIDDGGGGGDGGTVDGSGGDGGIDFSEE